MARMTRRALWYEPQRGRHRWEAVPGDDWRDRCSSCGVIRHRQPMWRRVEYSTGGRLAPDCARGAMAPRRRPSVGERTPDGTIGG